jgi:hypothetical protein
MANRDQQQQTDHMGPVNLMRDITNDKYKHNSPGIDEILDKLECLQRAQARTRGQIENLAEVTNLIYRILQVRGQVEELLLEQTLGTTSTSTNTSTI